MKTTTEKPAEALALLPEHMREPAVAYLLEQAGKFRVLKEQIAEGMQDVGTGRISEWEFRAIFARSAGLENQVAAPDALSFVSSTAACTSTKNFTDE